MKMDGRVCVAHQSLVGVQSAFEASASGLLSQSQLLLQPDSHTLL